MPIIWIHIFHFVKDILILNLFLIFSYRSINTIIESFIHTSIFHRASLLKQFKHFIRRPYFNRSNPGNGEEDDLVAILERVNNKNSLPMGKSFESSSLKRGKGLYSLIFLLCYGDIMFYYIVSKSFVFNIILPYEIYKIIFI